MAKISKDFSSGNLHSRETLFVSGNIAAINSEIILPSDGSASFAIDLRGTFNGTIEISGTIDGVNWTPIPVKPVNQTLKRYFSAITGTTQGVWAGSCLGYRQIRARASAWTSGTCVAFLSATTASLDQSLDGLITTDVITAVGAASAAVTLTIPAPGVGLRQYLTYLSINRFASALLTAAAVPVTITTTNLQGTLAFSFEADAAAQGTLVRWREDFAYPIVASSQNNVVTIVCPATTGVIWRVTAGWYVAP